MQHQTGRRFLPEARCHDHVEAGGHQVTEVMEGEGRFEAEDTLWLAALVAAPETESDVLVLGRQRQRGESVEAGPDTCPSSCMGMVGVKALAVAGVECLFGGEVAGLGDSCRIEILFSGEQQSGGQSGHGITIGDDFIFLQKPLMTLMVFVVIGFRRVQAGSVETLPAYAKCPGFNLTTRTPGVSRGDVDLLPDAV